MALQHRKLTNDNDWVYGNGNADIFTGEDGVAFNIKTRLQEFYNDAFFNLNRGIAWYEFIGRKQDNNNTNEVLTQNVVDIVSNTDGVVSVDNISFEYKNRKIEINISYKSIFSTIESLNLLVII